MNDGISIGIMTFNEERCIERCIESIKALADEIIVVDTGSTDGTKEIIKNMGIEKIIFYEKKWNNSLRKYQIQSNKREQTF